MLDSNLLNIQFDWFSHWTVFIICFLPYHVFMLWFHLNPMSEDEYDLFWHITRITGFCFRWVIFFSFSSFSYFNTQTLKFKYSCNGVLGNSSSYWLRFSLKRDLMLPNRNTYIEITPAKKFENVFQSRSFQSMLDLIPKLVKSITNRDYFIWNSNDKSMSK